MHPTFCLLQDIRTGVIIGRGTERQGLYYVDEVAHQGTVMLAHGTDNRDAWLWHRRLGHSSHGYSHLDTRLKTGLMEFKELFGSFTGHRVENRSTGMRYGSTGSAKSENQKVGF
ncbi:putative GAG-pre-integrase domain-containing protein [Helianthus debilis subsp. tardiflorus]